MSQSKGIIEENRREMLAWLKSKLVRKGEGIARVNEENLQIRRMIYQLGFSPDEWLKE